MDESIKAPCPNCGSSAALLFTASDLNRRIPGAFTYFKCPNCGLLFIDPIPLNLRDYYVGGYQKRPHTLEELRAIAIPEAYRLEPILAYKRSGKLLEIGPWIGLFSSNAKDAGFEISAIEIDSECVESLRNLLGAQAVQSDEPAATLREMNQKFDVIALWHSIEHLPKPWEVIREAARKLNPGGILLVSAPNPESSQLRVTKEKWYHLDAPRHLYFLPPSLVKTLAQQQGLVLLSETTNDRLGKVLDRMAWNDWIGRFMPIPGLRRIVKRMLSPIISRIYGSHAEGLGSGYTILMQLPTI